MRLFAFGFGYTVRHFVAEYRHVFTRVTGTVTTADGVGSLVAAGYHGRLFDGRQGDPRIPDDLAACEALLVSIPPGSEGDPVLNHYGEAIANSPTIRWIGYLSTIGVYGDQGDHWVDETARPNPSRPRTQERVAAEEAWLALGERSGKAVQVFRLAGIYGPGRNALLQVAAGTARRVIKPGQVFNRIHVSDIAAVLAASLEKPRPGAIYNVGDDEPAPPQDVVTFASELLGVEPPEEVPFEQAEMTPMAASFWGDRKHISNALVKSEFGLTLRYPTYREGLRALAEAGEGRI